MTEGDYQAAAALHTLLLEYRKTIPSAYLGSYTGSSFDALMTEMVMMPIWCYEYANKISPP